jgi:hypothetical protein
MLFVSASLFADDSLANPNIVQVYDSVLPQGDDTTIKNNEIYDVLVKSEKSDEELKAYKNQKINKIMYVMDTFIDSEKRVFRVFVMDTPKKDDETIITFDRLAFNYDPSNPALGQDYIQLDVPYEFRPDKDFIMTALMYVLAAMVLCPLLWFSFVGLRRMQKKAKLKLSKKEKADDLMLFLGKLHERSDFEEVFAKRDDIREFLDFDEEEFEILLKNIDQYQYMKTWNQDQFSLLRTQIEKLEIKKATSGV